jgi:excisionase family DNA binding protein
MSSHTHDDGCLITPDAAGELLGVDPRTVARWATDRHLFVTFTAGGHRRYCRDDVKRLKVELARRVR